MSLRAAIRPSERDALPKPAATDMSLAFAIDSNYLFLLPVLLASAALARTLLDAPMVIYSHEPKVLEDPLVRRVADRCVLIEGARLETLTRLARENVKRKQRALWNRSTFLKWAVFEEHPTESVLFLDVDMLILRPLDYLETLRPEIPFACAPQFMPSLKETPDQQPLSEDAAFANYEKSICGEFPEDMVGRVNSGVMLIRKPFLDPAFFDEITAFAGRQRLINEQSHLRQYFKTRPEKRLTLDASLNFQETFLGVMGPDKHQKMLQKIKVLHYAGPDTKPWNCKLGLERRFSLALWHWYRTKSESILAP